jgi:hypothetical protein
MGKKGKRIKAGLTSPKIIFFSSSFLCSPLS